MAFWNGRVRRSRLARWLEGRGELAKALSLAKRDAEAIARKAHELLETEDFHSALRLYDLMLELWPESRAFQAHLGRGAAYQMLGRLDEAERAYALALAIDPSSCHARLNRAEVRLIRGDAVSARTDLDLAKPILTSSRGDKRLRERFEALSAASSPARGG